MPQSTLKIDSGLLQQLKARTPEFMSVTAVVNLLVHNALNEIDSPTILGRALRPDPSKAVNKEEEERVRAREAQLQEELVHKPAPKRKTSHSVPEELAIFEPMIRAYWAAKPKTKTAAAWNLLMRELNKIHDQHGPDVVEEQLLQAEANRWQSITLKNYEQFGVKQPHRPGQAQEPEIKHPAYKVFRASDLGPEWGRTQDPEDWPESQTGGKGVLEGMF